MLAVPDAIGHRKIVGAAVVFKYCGIVNSSNHRSTTRRAARHYHTDGRLRLMGSRTAQVRYHQKVGPQNLKTMARRVAVDEPVLLRLGDDTVAADGVVRPAITAAIAFTMLEEAQPAPLVGIIPTTASTWLCLRM